MKYIGNAFSLNMLNSDVKIQINEISLKMAKTWAREENYQSVIGHETTAAVVSNLLDERVEFNRASLTLKAGDTLLVAQYSGARLEEGATELPEGSKIKWVLVFIAPLF